METVRDCLFSWAPKSLQMVTAAMKLRCLLLGRKAMTNLDSIFKSRDITLPTKGRLDKAMVFPVVMYRYELDHKESWAPKNWCFWTVVLEKTLESPLGSKEIKPVNPKGNQLWIFVGRVTLKLKLQYVGQLMRRAGIIGKDPEAGMDWRQEEKGMAKDEMVGWHHRLNGHWVWTDSSSCWWTGKSGVLQSMGSQRVGHNWPTMVY